ncbi:uncharacterized protein AC631_03520 [Debaryomyces fabryi]|uniref:Phospholipase D1 n=1 Tax=Debaryomyces fabryi TaxID=58627 RepID=A0A0V1PWP3_9ASCO|nr:uncharacterized protein AC631_03520 [Debaryomyces fabryi]KSA00701.1 hypothetical protein AC631_03520 [Debaryomyces fabryi]CUM52126.1 unnamed protein product [Debaryomyces fabryi]
MLLSLTSVSNEPSNNDENKYGMKYNSRRISLPRFTSSDNGFDEDNENETNNATNKENIPNGNDVPTGLRENEDPEEIYRIVSGGSKTGNGEQTKLIPRNDKKSRIGNYNDSSNIVGNAWSFFNRNEDKQELRYENEDEEQRDVTPYTSQQPSEELEPQALSNDVESPGQISPQHIDDTYRTDDINQADSTQVSNDQPVPSQPQPTRGQSFSNFLPAKFGGRSHHTGTPNNLGDDKWAKSKRKFQFFSRKNKNKDKESRRGTTVAAPDEEEADRATGERAQLLVGTLIIGSPAINLLASCLLEDEKGIARSPLLLTLIGFKITDISLTITTKNRKFRIDLEYGVGPQRLKWAVERNAKDLLYLHSRFKFDSWKKEVVRSKNSELPKYPMPPFRGRGNAEQSNTKQGSHQVNPGRSNPTSFDGNERMLEAPHNDNASIATGRSFGDRFSHLRAHLSSVSSASTEIHSPEQLRTKMAKNQDYINQVTNYLNELIKLVALKPQSNKLFQFFEISPISSLLSYETGFLGKQGVIHIGGSAKSQGWRVGHFKANDLKGMIDRRSEKWLLVRGSYVMYVADINATSPLEVFLVDSKFRIHYHGDDDKSYLLSKDDEESDYDDSSLIQNVLGRKEDSHSEDAHKNVFKHLNIVLENSERKLVLIPKSQKEKKLWIKSLTDMKASTIWSEPHRFGSFAPIRSNCFAQWFVDGRDYFWAVSSALEMAKDVIFIHDWWLSPELYLRRPANGNQQWRIDRILQRKAQQGVKIFIIVYRNVGSTVSTDSLYTKHSLLSLNEENIHVIRSPNQLLQNTYFWAHHEKLCIIDQTVAFLGGIDLCYGRFDTPDHVLVDDSKMDFNSLDSEFSVTPEEYIRFQTFPGKDYSNPRVKDFLELDKPYESMYDRNAVPRMPWHDVHMVTSGKVARDLSRHFVQRWNYLIRQKRPSRYTPLLTPPPDFSEEEAAEMGLDGTCEVQLLRSSGNWSLGLKEHEQSIQNAYLKLIETSEHFVYIENQFFVTSCVIDGNEIQNRIGDALVDRIIRAHNEGTNWRAVIVIPLMPGFESQVDEPDGSSVRVIMQCQFMSISRQPTSIFAKLRKYGIDPDDYIQFFSLRKWGIIGPDRTLVTEQLYIHAKTMIVDDRAAIIGSANINERSMRGSRDSEVAAIVRDNKTVKSRMNGEEYLAGKFAYTLRMRLMREHLGVSVDILDIVERRFNRFEEFARTSRGIKAATSRFKNKENTILSAMVEIASRDILDEPNGTYRWKNYQRLNQVDEAIDQVPLDDVDEEEKGQNIPSPLSLPISFSNRTGTHEANKGIRDSKKHSYDARVQHNENHKKDVFGEGPDKYKSKLAKRARLNSARFLKELASKAMEENPVGIFLPDGALVKDFLESDDCEMIDEMDEESENIISERNRERWQLLKKVSYLQRVAARTKEQSEEESKKRVAAGMEPFNLEPLSQSSMQDNKLPEPVDGMDNTNQKIVSSLDPSNYKSPNSTSEKKSFDPVLTPAEYSDDIPIVSLDEEGVRQTVQTVNSEGIENFSTFVDPYGFEDPLDEEFYEDLWYEHARRNTELFRMIFHTQPDNAVSSWKEYKNHSKLQRAFLLSQQHEAKSRKQKKYYNGGQDDLSLLDIETDNNTEYRKPDMNKRNSQATINVKKLEDVGLLGEVPLSSNSSTSLPSTNVRNEPRSRFRRNAKKNIIPELNEDESDTFEDAEEHMEYDEEPSSRSPESENNQKYAAQNGSVPQLNVNGGTYKENEVDESLAPTKKRRRRKTFSARRKAMLGERIFERDTAERILREIQGHLVVFPADWLMRELEGGNWFYNTDRIPPIDIYD